jgi:hypothetical protein
MALSVGKTDIVGMDVKLPATGVRYFLGLVSDTSTDHHNKGGAGQVAAYRQKKIQELVNQQRTDLADVAVLDLDHANSILDSFTNSQGKRFSANEN